MVRRTVIDIPGGRCFPVVYWNFIIDYMMKYYFNSMMCFER